MALTERSRAALFQGLQTIVTEEVAQDMLSQFPARDIDEPISRDYLDARLASLRADIQAEFGAVRLEQTGLGNGLRAEIAALREEMRAGDAALRVDMLEGFAAGRDDLAAGLAAMRAEMQAGDAALRDEIGALRRELHAQLVWTIGTIITMTAVIVGAIAAFS